MKSKKALEYIEKTYASGGIITLDSFLLISEKAVELAEQEMIEKAVEAFCDVCGIKNNNQRNIENCSIICSRIKEFINRLNNKQI